MKQETLKTLGWREYVALPALNLQKLKCKVDTGARTSCLHAFFVEPYQFDGNDWVRFGIHPLQNSTEEEVICCAPVSDQRMVSDSGGHKELRYVINTPIIIGSQQFNIDLTLTNRDTMKFRMLLGRTAMEHRYMVIPHASYLCGLPQAASQ